MSIRKMKRDRLKGKKFLATLTQDEMVWVAEQMAVRGWNRHFADKALSLWTFVEGEKEMFIEQFKQGFKKKGNQQLAEIVEGEMEDVEIRMGINVAGKQKDLAGLSDKVLSIFSFVLGNPQIQQTMQAIPGLAKSFNDILEFSGISPVDFSTFTSGVQQMMQPQPQPQPMLPSPQQV